MKKEMLLIISLSILFGFGWLIKPEEEKEPKPVKFVFEPTILQTEQVFVPETKPEPAPFDCESDEKCRLLAEVVYYEARGESDEGKIAVAYVVINRKNRWYFPNTIKDVVYHKCHFSYTCQVDTSKPRKRDSWKKSLDIAEKVYLKKVPDPTNDSDHYFNPRKVKAPHWSTVYPKVISLGNHVFHKRG